MNSYSPRIPIKLNSSSEATKQLNPQPSGYPGEEFRVSLPDSHLKMKSPQEVSQASNDYGGVMQK